jgi:aspartyl-tRNA(Asn)/glutamyl-tRNA(Gln) amidotransferase subunit B
LATATKLTCRCRNRLGDPPNTNVCPGCVGMPGALPVMNAAAVDLAMKVGLALHCTVADVTTWHRKSYFYPDIPHNFQISQLEPPLSGDGWLDVPLADGSTKRVRIKRAHLEEDAGKNVHDAQGHTGVDLNRAGVPLVEIVSQPDMNSAEEAVAYAKAIQRLVRWLGASEANMQMGHIRFEPNVNLHITRGGRVYKTPISEVKNLNSFRSIERAVAYEITRQYEQWQAAPENYSREKIGKNNRGFDDVRGVTVYQREKEEAHDYRYFPEPDLLPVRVDEAWRSRVAASVGELPLARRTRYMEQHGLTFKEADALTQDAPTGNLLDTAVSAGADAKRVTNLLLGRGAAIANERGCDIAEVGVTATQLTELAMMLSAGEINATSAAKVFDELAGAGETAAVPRSTGVPPVSRTDVPSVNGAAVSPRALAETLGLLTVKDTAAVEAWVDEAIAANPQAVADVKEGGKKLQKAFGFLMGQVMQKSKGAAPPADVKRLLEEKLK